MQKLLRSAAIAATESSIRKNDDRRDMLELLMKKHVRRELCENTISHSTIAPPTMASPSVFSFSS